MTTMTYLTLVLLLASGEQTRTAMPAWECHSIASQMHQAWQEKRLVDRQADGVPVVDAWCTKSTLEEIHAIESDGPCEVS